MIADWRNAAPTADVAFLPAFPSLFSIINPIGGALILDAVTARFDHADRVRVSRLAQLPHFANQSTFISIR